MNYHVLMLVALLSTITFVGCKKQVEQQKPHTVLVLEENNLERFSGPVPVDIVWEEIDLK